MKTVTLLRHAKSDWSDSTLRDFDRPLNGRGERAAALMGSWARREGLRFDAIVASPAARVRDTFARFVQSYGHDGEPAWDKRLYLASAATIDEVIGGAAGEDETLLVVGHNPGLEEFILAHVPDQGEGGLRGDVAEKFPTAAIAVLDFDVAQWSDIARDEGKARLRRFVRPRDLDPALGPEY